MDKGDLPSPDNFRIFKITLNEKYRFYLFIIALFGLPIGLFSTSQYMMFFSYISQYLLDSPTPSQLIQLLFSYVPLIGISAMVQLVIGIMCLYLLVKIYAFQSKLFRTDEKTTLFAFPIDEEKRIILLGISLYGIIMYTFNLMQWINSLIYNIKGSLLVYYLYNSSIPQSIFNIIVCCMVIIISFLILTRLYTFQGKERAAPKIFSFTYSEHYIPLVYILALIGIFTSVLFYIITNLVYLLAFLPSLFNLIHNEAFALYYGYLLLDYLIEIVRGVILLVASILTLKNILKYQRPTREEI